jgi:hypothetical protein
LRTAWTTIARPYFKTQKEKISTRRIIFLFKKLKSQLTSKISILANNQMHNNMTKNYMNYLEKKESGIHIRVCLEVLNLQLKIIWYYK